MQHGTCKDNSVSPDISQKKKFKDEILYLNSIIHQNYVTYTPACATTEG